MREAAIAAAIVACCGASRVILAGLRGADGLLWALGALAAGVVGSLGTGAAYHGALWMTLGRRGALPPGWWWSPTRYHGRLTAADRWRVLPWFYGGAASFVLVVLGAGAVLYVVFAGR